MGHLKQKIRQIELELAADRESLTWQTVFFKHYISSPRGIISLMIVSFGMSYILVNRKQFLRTTYKILTSPLMLKYVYKNLVPLGLRFLPQILRLSGTRLF
ncbi:hypothetical protein BH10PSE19_BH10PSE19_00530 [soil metagenome]